MESSLRNLLGAWERTAQAEPPIRRSRGRAPLPRWDELPNTFFADAYREALRGDRPLGESAGPSTGPIPHSGDSGPASDVGTETAIDRPPQTSNSDPNWADIIAAATLEDEVKRLQQELSRSVTAIGKFRATDYKLAEEQLALLASYLAVIAEYPGEIRWQESAAGLAHLLARASRQAEERSTDAFAAAKQCRDLLTDLVRGTPPSDKPAEPLPADWSQLVRRNMLMRRLELASDQRLAEVPASDRRATDPAALSNLHREAQLVRLIARLLRQPGMEDGADADYQKFCADLDQAAQTILDGLPTADNGAVTAGINGVKQSCAACHDAYRG